MDCGEQVRVALAPVAALIHILRRDFFLPAFFLPAFFFVARFLAMCGLLLYEPVSEYSAQLRARRNVRQCDLYIYRTQIGRGLTNTSESCASDAGAGRSAFDRRKRSAQRRRSRQD